MRVLLIRPPNPTQTIGLRYLMICEPLELEYVAAGLDGHEVQILDLLVEKGLERRLADFRPDVVGTSSYITGVNEVKKLCRRVKAWNPECFTVVGGLHAARVPDDFADASVDCIVLGDGTSVLPEVLSAIEAATPLDAVAGLALPADSGLRRTAERPYMPAADTLPFPRRDLVAHLRDRYYYLYHRPLATMKTTWGCWYRCNFCFTWTITGGAIYSRSAESIAHELQTIETEDVYIVDDVFLINRPRLARLAALLRERGIRKTFLVFGRADFIAENEDVIAEWADLGLSAVLIGLEATTDGELTSMHKETSVDTNVRAIAVLRRHGVDVYGSFVTQPNYTPEDWRRLNRFIERNGLCYLNVSPLTPLPGTDAWRQYERQLVVDRRAHALFDLSHVLLPTTMPLKAYYRALLGVYIRACLDPRRTRRFSQRASPPLYSRRYLRLMVGAFRILLQMLTAHRHHAPAALASATSTDVAPPHAAAPSGLARLS